MDRQIFGRCAMRGFFRKVLTAALVLVTVSAACSSLCEGFIWDCPVCGREGNRGSFCGTCGYPAPAPGETPEPEEDIGSGYEKALQRAGRDLSNLDSLREAVSVLEKAGTYAYSKSYLMYFRALLEIQETNDLDTAGIRLGNCSHQAGFVADLQERKFPSCDELLKYVDARKLEAGGKTQEAYNAFVALTVLDSPERAFELGLIAAKETPAPTEKAVSTPIPTAESKPAVPVFSEVYPGMDASLKKAGDDGYRVYSFVGPGKAYVASGGYKPAKQKKITVYFEEDGYVLADVQYQTTEERFVYLPVGSFTSANNIPGVSDLKSYSGTANANITPSWGPANRFSSVGSLTVDKGTRLTVFFQENGYVYAEYSCGKGKARMWLPADKITIKDAAVTLSDTLIKPAGESSFK